MPESRTVECQDCGYRWESSASNPRCSQSDCGRSRNVEPVNGESESSTTTEDDTTSTSTGEQNPDPDSTPADEVDPDEDDSGSDGGFTPAFETRQTSTDSETTTDAPDLSSTSTESDDESESEDADTEDASTSEEPDPAEDIPEIDPEQLEVAFNLTFEAVATRRGEHWELEDGEATKLGKAWAPVANEYAPILFREHTAVGVALVASMSILAPRLAKDKELDKLAERQEREAENGEPGEERSPDPGGDLDAEPDTEDWMDDSTDQSATAGGYSNV